MRILYPSAQFAPSQVKYIIDFGAHDDAPAMFRDQADLAMGTLVITHNGNVREPTQSPYVLQEEYCCLVMLNDSRVAVASRGGVAQYLRRSLQEPMVELE